MCPPGHRRPRHLHAHSSLRLELKETNELGWQKSDSRVGAPNDSGVPQSSLGRVQHGNPGKQAQFHLWDSVADEASALTNVNLLFLCEGDRPYHSGSSSLYHEDPF